MGNTPTSNTAFRTAANAGRGGTAGLVVDMQLGCITHMDPKDAENYLASLATQIEDLRTRKPPIPVLWATVDDPDNTKFHSPVSKSEEPRANADFKKMGFYAVAPDKDPNDLPNKKIFDDFINEHGPRENEAVFTKPAFNAFATSEKDRLDANIPLEAMSRINAEHEKFVEHLKSTGTKKLGIFGAVGSVCCLESAMGAVQNGFKPSLMLDGIVCWSGEGQKSQLVWRYGFTTSGEANNWHSSEIEAAPHKPSRGFSEADIQSAAQVRLETYEAFASPKSVVSKPAENRFKM